MLTTNRHCAHRSITSPVTLSGVGLFSALASTITLKPALAGSGIVFHRADLPDQPVIPARVGHVMTSPRKTVLVARSGDQSSPGVHTVEHLLSALVALGVTDVQIEIHGAEVPMLDGSSLGFAEALMKAGVGVIMPITPGTPVAHTPANGAAHLNAPGSTIKHTPIVVDRLVRVEKNGAWIEAHPLAPAAELIMDAQYALNYGPGSPIASQTARFVVNHTAPNAAAYVAQIAPARTFCTLDEAVQMRQAGLFNHLREGDTLVIGPDGPLGTTYRFDDEPARHKLLDLIGDLALAGRPIVARIVASQSGHHLNHEMAAVLAGQF